MKKSRRLMALCLVAALTFVLLPGLLQAEEQAVEKEQTIEKVNINKATVEELTQLHGVGPAYAELIVEYREAHGPFERPEGIMNVKGIGQKIWETNKDLITIE
ncbi:MAG: helix-hairpin-helix domain-containing protein [Pseudomonadota bacterium]